MAKAKANGSTKQHGKAKAINPKSGSNSSNAKKSNKGPTKKAMNNRKRSASRSDDDTSLDEHEEPHPRKKTRHADEEVEVDHVDDEEPEEIDEDGEATVGEEGEKVCCLALAAV